MNRITKWITLMIFAIGLIATSLVIPSSAQAASTDARYNFSITAANDPKLPVKYRIKSTDTQAQRIAKARAATKNQVFQKTAGGALVFKNSTKSNRMIRVWKDNGCPNTLEGYKRSDVVYEGQYAAFGSVDSFYQGKWRKTYQSYWGITNITTDQGECLNVYPSPTLVVKIIYYKK